MILCNACGSYIYFQRINKPMGCSQLSSATIADPLPVNNQNQFSISPSNIQFKLLTTTIVTTALQAKKKPVRKAAKQEKIRALTPPNQHENLSINLQFTKNQLHHPKPNQSNIIELLKDQPQQKTLFKRAQDLCKSSSYQDALILYKKMTIEDSYIHTQKGHCNYELQNYEEAIKEYIRSLEIKGDHMPTYFRLGLAYYYKEDYSKALEMYEKALNLAVNSEIYYQMGLCYYYLEQYNKSIECYKKGLEQSAENYEIMQAIADSYFYKQDYNQSISWLKKVIESSPQNAKALADLGLCYYWLQAYAEAKSWFQKSLLIDPHDPETHARFGQNYSWMEDYDKAIQQFQKSIELSPKNQSYYISIGDNKRYQLLPNEAIAWYRKAMKINPDNRGIYQGLSNAYSQQSQFKEAIAQLKKGIKVDPQFATFYEMMGDCYFEQEEYQTAIENYNVALSKQRANISYCTFMVAKSYYFNQQYIEALPFFVESIKLSPDQLLNQVQYGKCLFQMENFSQSYKVFNKAKEIYQKTQNGKDYSQQDYWVKELNNFIENASEWQQKKKIGYVSPQDKEEIKKMRKSFQKKYKTIFGLQKANKKTVRTKPLDQQFLQVVSLIHKDGFKLDISSAQAPIFKIVELVRNIYNYDSGSFQIFAYIFQEYMWLQKFEAGKSIVEIESCLNKVIEALSNLYPSVVRKQDKLSQSAEFPTYKQIKLNLFTEVVYFESYDIVVHEIQKISLKAKNDLAPFKEFVYALQKKYQGSHAKVGLKLPQKKQNMANSQKARYQQKLFKVLMRIFQKMFKEIVHQKEQMLGTINQRVSNGKQLPLYSINQIIMNTWIQYINNILAKRKEEGIKTECYVTDLVRGKCMFQSIPAIQKAADGLIQMCKEKGYQIMELDNRLQKKTQDVVFKIKIKEVVSELQLALQFDTVAFEFNHNFYEIQRCPLGCIFGSSLLLTKDVSESFLKQVADSIQTIKATKTGKQYLKPLHFVLNSFKKSSKIRQL